MMDLEDGELPSSDNEGDGSEMPEQTNYMPIEIPDDEDYVIVDRPKPSILSSSSSNTPSSGSMSHPPPRHQPPNQSYFEFVQTNSSNMHGSDLGQKAYYKDLGVSDLLDSSEKDSSSASDSDTETRNDGKRFRMTSHPQIPVNSGSNASVPFGGGGTTFGFAEAPTTNSFQVNRTPTDFASDSFAQAAEAFRSEAAKFQKERKTNTVWSSVIQEEQISTIFDRVKVTGPADVEIERGPESYSFQRPMRQPRPRRPSDSSDISSEGLSDNALHYLRDGFSYDDDETEESSEHALPKSFTSSSVSKSSASRKATKRKRERQKYKRKLINRLKKMKALDLAHYMGNKLHEEKVTLLFRSIEILGKENCVRIFLKTLKIERRGGVMVKNQERRRTGGGVFLYLIRGDRRFPKSQIDLIFREERAYHDKVRKKKLVGKRLKKKAKLEAAKAEMEANGMRDEDESDDDDTTVPNPDADGTDTGQFGDDSTQESSIHDKDITEELGSMNCDGSDP
ncbi:Phosphorylated adapter RNA export protein [Orchesella cincta]|uniref:Phosphorylated adapter RNA export protein n=1 Tax=Orchesella cincta TaxID=48709 RepID=A0A1D2N4Z8_ORCCI|nr:Phosphorylated adapter RNA export protein [Orchesella cincta]